jgi:two-component system chemotaxis response regulator CheY
MRAQNRCDVRFCLTPVLKFITAETIGMWGRPVCIRSIQAWDGKLEMSSFRVDYGSMRALVALSNKQLAEYIWHFLKDNGAQQVQLVHHSKDAVSRMRDFKFTHFFVGHHLEEFGGCDFTRFIRMCNGEVAEAPVIMVMSNPDREKVIDARDSGVSEIMSVPFTGKQMEQRLEHLASRPKEFVRTSTYIGPDRRRAHSDNYRGGERRKDSIRVAKLQNQDSEKIGA